MLILNVFGFIFTMKFDVLHVNMLKNILVSLLAFYPFYYYANIDLLNRRVLIMFFIGILIINIFQFYSTQNILMELENSEYVVNNIAYSFAFLIPYLFLFKKNRIIAGVLLAVILFYLILGNKRGAVISAGIEIFIFVYYQLSTFEKRIRLKGYLISIVLLSVVGFFVYKTYISNEFLIKRMESISQGNSSRRNIIYTNIFFTWLNSNSLWHYFFGYGFAASLKLSGIGTYAHNDWLELLSSFGFLGLSVYVFLLNVALKAIWNKKWESNKKILMLAIVAMWLPTTIYSMWYSAIDVYTQAILLAFLFGSKKYYLP